MLICSCSHFEASSSVSDTCHHLTEPSSISEQSRMSSVSSCMRLRSKTSHVLWSQPHRGWLENGSLWFYNRQTTRCTVSPSSAEEKARGPNHGSPRKHLNQVVWCRNVNELCLWRLKETAFTSTLSQEKVKITAKIQTNFVIHLYCISYLIDVSLEVN